ncbi:MAG TPA: MFS transporter [Polyangiaceae bacterium LLY-WYZ-15_(1-7)]|nr:MFS transporter [Polyangiaceae bacterium LLY-WYZ-15_(1-7)]HJL04315.1 MFS transporter [Polyangiaceae bacterium LLY-WYZ-15_(1-7)]HJL08803.1 MFS transporter [Polyangiaceae bacterium LLY-WYZ-15_(1-7)]HJL26944.1 MFS transporter [Polyangiaceae bacterium LLY-WYZ-15_(1-7)]HJL47531.1 MFS transporter [Polyangiaceae bacterium LLY-WYZ-15_(1-7)]
MSAPPASAGREPESTRAQRAAWCLFDFANSPFPTIALTAFGAPYFANVLVGEEGLDLFGLHLSGASAWGLAIGTSMALVTLSSPLMGALADRGGVKRRLLAVYVLLGVLATAALGLLGPGAGVGAFLLYVVANFAFEGAYVFYNAFLPELVPPERVGRLSGAGWGLGYLGGLGALFAVKPFIPEDYTASEGAGVIYFVVAAWYLVFSLPTLLLLKDRAPRAKVRAGEAFREVARTLKGLRAHAAIALFLVAYFLYTDALTTVIHFTGIYTDEVLSFSPSDNVQLFLVLNVVAAPGALAFGWLLDRIGGKRTIALSLIGWMAVIVFAVLAQTKAGFWPAAIVAAVVIGATQSASRAFMATLAPPDRAGEFMGFLALSGKASAIVGPLVYGGVSQALADPANPGRSHRIAISVIGLFFVVALLVLSRVPSERPAGGSE